MTINNVNKKIYVGVHSTKDPEQWDYYLGCAIYANRPSTYQHPKTVFQYAVKKYGPKNFTRKTLAVFNNSDDAFDLESQIVTKDFLSRKDVYNMVLGGHGGDIAEMATECHAYDVHGNYVRSFKSIQAGADWVNRGRTTIGRGIYQRILAGGYYWSLDKVDVLDLTLFKTDTNKKTIHMYDKFGSYEKTFQSISDAAKELDVSTGNVVRSAKMGYLINNKYFSYEKSNTFSKAKTIQLLNRKVYQYDLDGNFIKEFDTVGQARRELNLKSDIGAAIKKGATCGGFQWSIEKLEKMPKISIKNTARKVAVYDLSGNFIEQFDTVTECQKKYSSCKHVLHGKRKTGNNCIFKYLD